MKRSLTTLGILAVAAGLFAGDAASVHGNDCGRIFGIRCRVEEGAQEGD